MRHRNSLWRWGLFSVAAALVVACSGDQTGPADNGTDTTTTDTTGADTTGADTSDVATIPLVDSVPIPPNYGIHDTFVRDGLAFVSAWNTGLRIYDVGNGIRGGSPQAPVLVGSVVTSAHNPSGGASVHNSWWFHNPVTGEARYLFVGEEGPSGGIGVSATGDIHVVDVSDLSHPVEVGFYHMPAINGDSAGTHNFWMDESRQILYAAYYNGGVVALDVSGTLSGDLSSREIARIRPGGDGNTYVWGVQLAPDGSLYALDMVSGLWHLKLENGEFQVLGGGNNVPDRWSSDLWVTSGFAYTGTWGKRGGRPGNAVKIWRLTSGGSPELTDSIVVQNYGTVSDIEVSADGKLLMVTAEQGTGSGLYIYSLANPAHPQLVGQRLVNSVTAGLHTGTFADIGGRRYIFAARDPAAPALMIFDVTSLVK